MNYVERLIPALVDAELKEANRQNPPFHSMHEGYAVLKEEVEETEEALEVVKDYLASMWRNIRRDDTPCVKIAAEYLEHRAIHMAAEAIQVAAMAKKFQAIGKEV